jgi:hypothetical protein
MLPPGRTVTVCLPVRVLLALERERAHAEQAVFALQDNADAVGQIVGNESGDAYAQVHVVAVVQFLGRDGSHFIPGPGHGFSLGF